MPRKLERRSNLLAPHSNLYKGFLLFARIESAPLATTRIVIATAAKESEVNPELPPDDVNELVASADDVVAVGEVELEVLPIEDDVVEDCWPV